MGNLSEFGKSVKDVIRVNAPMLPELAGAHFERPEWKAAIDGGDRGMASLYGLHVRLREGAKALKERMESDTGLPRSAHFLDVKRDGENWLKAVDRQMASAMRVADEEMTRTKLEMHDFLRTGPMHESRHADMIRTHVKALPDDQRMAFVNDAIEGADAETLSAILNAPAYLTGLTPDQLDGVRLRYERKYAPDMRARLDMLAEARKTVDGALTGAAVYFNAIFPESEAKAAMAEKERVETLRRKMSAD